MNLLDQATKIAYDFVVPVEERALTVTKPGGLQTQTGRSVQAKSCRSVQESGPAFNEVPAVPIEQLALVRLFEILQRPIRECEILGNYRRVILVRYTPYAQSDPVLPVCLVDLGKPYLKAVRRFAKHLGRWDNWNINQVGWGRKSGKLVKQCLRSLDRVSYLLTPGEMAYLQTHLALSAAKPGRVVAHPVVAKNNPPSTKNSTTNGWAG